MFLISFGTRPEFIKIKPLILKFKGIIPFKLLFTGQHKNLLPEDIEAEHLEIIDGPNRLDSIVTSILNKDQIFNKISSVIVQGDTTSAFAVALAAFHRKIKIVHLEAGLRTYDKDHPYPEEFNRRAIAAMADIHLCPTEVSKNNLYAEGIKNNVFVVGNTSLDNLNHIEPSYEDTILITLHRRENHSIMDKWFIALNQIAELYPKYNFILPIHPNPEVQKHRSILKNIKVINPLTHEECCNLIAKSKIIITDSGGIQEEASFFKKRSLVCREKTERVEGLGSFSILTSPDKIQIDFESIITNYHIDLPCPYGDGMASQKILEILKQE